MEKTLIQQNPQWNGKPFKGLTERSIIKNLLGKKDFAKDRAAVRKDRTHGNHQFRRYPYRYA